MVEVAAAAGKLQSRAAQIELAASAALSDRVRDWPGVADTVDKRHVSAEQMSACELACALNRSPAAAMNRVQLAQHLRRLPPTRAALAAGAIDLNKARMAVEVLRPLSDADAAAVEGTVIAPEQGRVREGNGRVPSQLRQALRRAAIRVNPKAYEKQERDAFDQRRMEHYPLGDSNPGMAGLGFTHREDVIAEASDYIRALAKAAIAADAPGQQRTLDQACADVAADLLTGRTVRTATRAGSASTSGPSVHVVVGVADPARRGRRSRAGSPATARSARRPRGGSPPTPPAPGASCSPTPAPDGWTSSPPPPTRSLPTWTATSAPATTPAAGPAAPAPPAAATPTTASPGQPAPPRPPTCNACAAPTTGSRPTPAPPPGWKRTPGTRSSPSPPGTPTEDHPTHPSANPTHHTPNTRRRTQPTTSRRSSSQSAASAQESTCLSAA